MASITFEAAVELAKRTHASQVDQAGRPYLGHVLRVADAVRRDTERFAALIGDVGWGRRSGEDVARIAAVLHDILEDTDVTDEDLREAGCDDALMESLVALTRPEGEAYSDFLERLSADPVAVMVKRADIADNADEARLRLLPPEKAAALREKYRRAERELGFWALYRKVASLENDHPDGHHVYFRKT
jgi:(p)ppGpp synthase/HD superfamily hydrolase